MPKAENKTLRATFFWNECYLANQPLSAVGILEDNAQGWKIVQTMNSWV